TKNEDALLFQYMARIATQTSELKGNKIYQAFAKENPRHLAQSWRDRAIRCVLPTTNHHYYNYHYFRHHHYFSHYRQYYYYYFRHYYPKHLTPRHTSPDLASRLK